MSFKEKYKRERGELVLVLRCDLQSPEAEQRTGWRYEMGALQYFTVWSFASNSTEEQQI